MISRSKGLSSVLHILLITMIVCVVSIIPAKSLACSEIWIKDHQHIDTLISARTFDFMSGEGFIQYRPRGSQGQAQYTAPSAAPLKWTSKYAAIIFKTSLAKGNDTSGKFAADVDGMNEAGLKIGTYFLESSVFPISKMSTMVDIGSLSQYLLENFDTVSGAVKDLRLNKYSVIPLPTNGLDIKLHLYLHDRKGESAIIEFINGEINIVQNPKIPVITNTAYEDSLNLLKNYEGFGGTQHIPGTQESIDRFVRAAFYRSHLASPQSVKQAVDYGFAAIQTVSVSPKFVHGCTQWIIVSDVIGRKIYFRTLNNPCTMTIDLVKLAASSKNEVSEINVLRTDLHGDITKMF